MADNEIAWLAGLLEGEGCFQKRVNHNPLIQLIMCDKDVVIKAAKIMGAHKVVQVKKDTRGGKQLYRAIVYGATAISVMNKILPFMGERRSGVIKSCLEDYAVNLKYKERRPYSRGAIIVWQKNMSDENMVPCLRTA